ncbi:sensor domain-containing diguanylate cyclase [Marinobacterium arenosum]|uniref:sensor domain-containing diguanylate cyclase n=1 Tax=Marinobacterium arenosum TaxID=2862496 RepID=UPI001C984E97|nr:cache domain-containing protein [Marinobacterium arenosum]MBY4676317.1 cache domain-containing protein [Marinobacterium arenosum]
MILKVVVAVTLTIGVVGFLWIESEYETLARDNQRLAEEYHQEQKWLMRAEVLRVRDHLLRQKVSAEGELEAQLQRRVSDAYEIAMGIYRQYRGQLADGEIQQRIIDALRYHRLSAERSYYFIDSLDGVGVLYPPNPATEGRPIVESFGDDGLSLFDEMWRLVQQRGEGFIHYEWPRPDGGDRRHKKYSYVKLFEPYGWIIGSGDYLESFEKKMREKIFRDIAQVSYGANNEGYFFINSYQGDLYLTNGQYFGGSKNIWHVEDARGEKVVQENARIARTQLGGGYNRYFWNKLNGETAEKIAFVIGMDEWQIFIGTGAYLDTITEEIARRDAALQQRVHERVRAAVAVLLLAFLLIGLLAYFIGRKLAGNFRLFQSSFDSAVDNGICIDEHNVHFEEFKRLARSANGMIKRLNRQAEALRHSASHDALTALPNRVNGTGHLNAMLHRAADKRSMLAVLFVDLDNFKEVNDTFGHATGDHLLREVAERLRKVVREEDQVVRLGGDEFIITTGFLHRAHDAEVIAAKVQAVFASPFRLAQRNFYVTASIGVAVSPEGGRSAGALLHNADVAMYRAKSLGKNAYFVFDSTLADDLSQQLETTEP